MEDGDASSESPFPMSTKRASRTALLRQFGSSAPVPRVSELEGRRTRSALPSPPRKPATPHSSTSPESRVNKSTPKKSRRRPIPSFSLQPHDATSTFQAASPSAIIPPSSPILSVRLVHNASSSLAPPIQLTSHIRSLNLDEPMNGTGNAAEGFDGSSSRAVPKAKGLPYRRPQSWNVDTRGAESPVAPTDSLAVDHRRRSSRRYSTFDQEPQTAEIRSQRSPDAITGRARLRPLSAEFPGTNRSRRRSWQEDVTEQMLGLITERKDPDSVESPTPESRKASFSFRNSLTNSVKRKSVQRNSIASVFPSPGRSDALRSPHIASTKQSDKTGTRSKGENDLHGRREAAHRAVLGDGSNISQDPVQVFSFRRTSEPGPRATHGSVGSASDALNNPNNADNAPPPSPHTAFGQVSSLEDNPNRNATFSSSSTHGHSSTPSDPSRVRSASMFLPPSPRKRKSTEDADASFSSYPKRSVSSPMAPPRSILKSSSPSVDPTSSDLQRQSKRLKLSLTEPPSSPNEFGRTFDSPLTPQGTLPRVDENFAIENRSTGDHLNPLLNSTSTHPHSASQSEKTRPTSIVSVTPSAARILRRESMSSRMTTGDRAIPMRAIVSPRPASFQGQVSEYHMQDPHTSKRYTRRCGWDSVTSDEPLPIHGWLFIAGFILPPLWWIGSFLRPRRVISSRLRENGLWEEWNDVDPLAVTWRFRCRLISALSVLLYVPIITLAIIFGR